jgi:hypothetical protein
MLNGHQPDALAFRDLLLTSAATNRTSVVHFTHYNDQGYQFTAPAGRAYWLHWDTPVRVDPGGLTLHKMDLMGAASGWMQLQVKYVQQVSVKTRAPQWHLV